MCIKINCPVCGFRLLDSSPDKNIVCKVISSPMVAEPSGEHWHSEFRIKCPRCNQIIGISNVKQKSKLQKNKSYM